MTNTFGYIVIIFIILICAKPYLYFKMSDINDLDKLLKTFKSKKRYKKEMDFQNDLYKYLKLKLKNKIEKPKGSKRQGTRDSDLLYKKIYPIETKINFSYTISKSLRTQIPDYVNGRKHIHSNNLSLKEKLMLRFFDMQVFIVIAGIKNKNALTDFKRDYPTGYGNRVHYYIVYE